MRVATPLICRVGKAVPSKDQKLGLILIDYEPL
jgi:hypothetical protein